MNAENYSIKISNNESHVFDYSIDEGKSIHDVFECKDIPSEEFVGLSRSECLLFINKVLDPNVKPLTFVDMLDDILCQSITNIVGKFTIANRPEYSEDAIWNSSVDGWDRWRREWKHISFFKDTSEDGRRMFNISLFGRDALAGRKTVFEWGQVRWKVNFDAEEAEQFIEDQKKKETVESMEYVSDLEDQD